MSIMSVFLLLVVFLSVLSLLGCGRLSVKSKSASQARIEESQTDWGGLQVMVALARGAQHDAIGWDESSKGKYLSPMCWLIGENYPKIGDEFRRYNTAPAMIRALETHRPKDDLSRRGVLTEQDVAEVLLAPIYGIFAAHGPVSKDIQMEIHRLGFLPVRASIIVLSKRYGPIQYFRSSDGRRVDVQFSWTGSPVRYKVWIDKPTAMEANLGMKPPHNAPLKLSFDPSSQSWIEALPHSDSWFALDEQAFSEFAEQEVDMYVKTEPLGPPVPTIS